MVQVKKRPLPSSSSDYETKSTSTSIEAYTAAKDEWRVTSDGYLPVHYPFGWRPMPPGETRNAIEKCQPAIEGILSQHPVGGIAMKLRCMWPKDEPEEMLDVLIIETDNQDEDKLHWKIACTDIFNLLVNQGGLDASQFRVEIINSAKTYQDISFCLPNDATILAAIRSVRSALFNAVEANLANNVTSISWHLRGCRGAPQAAMKISAMIFVKKNSVAKYEFVESEIERAISTTEFPDVTFHVEILQGEIDLGVIPPSLKQEVSVSSKKLNNMQPQPINGNSIGVVNGSTEDGAGTLGGWVNFKEKNGIQHRCFLTCYHVIQDGDIEHRTTNDKNGIGLEGGRSSSKPIEVCYPARCDAVATQKWLMGVVENTGQYQEFYKAQLKQLKQLKNVSIGSVLRASGHRRAVYHTDKFGDVERRLDWALIESPTTFSRNRPPPGERVIGWPDFALPPPDHVYMTFPDEVVTEVAEPIAGEWLIQRGRSSMASGQMNIEPKAIKWYDWPGEPWSLETEVIGCTNDFAMPGDSGAWIYNQKKEVVGLLFARSTTDCAGMMTPMIVVMEDIAKHAGGRIYLPS